MPLFRKNKVTVLYIHVPKTGGTSLERLFINCGWEVTLLDRNGPGTFMPHWRSSPQHLHAAILRERLRLDTLDVIFMTVREPLARFRSELLMRRPKAAAPWSEDAEEFTRDALRRYLREPYSFDNHMRPQHEFYVPGASVFRLEDGLQRAVQTLRNDHGLDLTGAIPHTRSRPGKLPSHDLVIPEGLRSRLIDLYRWDYVQFGYEVPDPL